MKSSVITTLCAAVVCAASLASAEEKKNVSPALNFDVKTLSGKDAHLGEHQGKVVLVVNVASQCGFTPQYKGLQGLHEKYADKGLVVLGFPCNQFGGQEPGSADEIAAFCSENYGVKFPLYEKIDVKGPNAAPLYEYLTSKESVGDKAGPIKWNFEKFLISRSGEVVARYNSLKTPAQLEDPIEAELAKK